MPHLEIADLIVAFDPRSGARLPVRRGDVVRALEEGGDRHAARIAAALPAGADDVLDPLAVDRAVVGVHTAVQRLDEETGTAERLVALLGPLFETIREIAGRRGRFRLVAVGSGLGHLVRRLAATGALGPGVELVGVDPNPALVAEAGRLARAEGLDCRFVHGNAFDLPEVATVYVSSGVLHHLRGPALGQFFEAQADSPALAFCHFDIAATRLAPLAACMFHRTRTSDPLARHDGVVSARRAHSDETLLRAATVPGIRPLVLAARGPSNPLRTGVRPVLGIRPYLEEPLRQALGAAAGRLVGAESLGPRGLPGSGRPGGAGAEAVVGTAP
ncbi:class I SAM-dependent methyltransferase [Streptomyces sp. ISL-66]|uniref:class I SAM-dependent methyltransferase n=1 Tax=Streptomyces sp. ISL-66 TaxID=2819186 RepID=UPI001BE84FA7|nr:class I SAM-dependent methyltransferase [Streptomyces sp. ISL-66]MBT2470609.1 class I SAM-dependent methyltransferase [Streptomyces sp. ISL-66]